MPFLPGEGGCEISSIIVDGYNLTGINHDDLAAEREKLIRILSGYRKVKDHDITLVFDGWKSGDRREVSVKTAGIRIIYSRLGETADAVIKRMIQTDKREWIVVSSDRDIASYAWSHGSVAVAGTDFRLLVGKASSPVSGDYEPLDEDEYCGSAENRGNPRKRSRREKALLRVLKKL